MVLKKKGLIAVVSVSSATALIVAFVLASNAANGGMQQPPTQLQSGADAAEANPPTGSEVDEANPTAGANAKTDRFGNIKKQLGEEAGLVDDKTKKTYFSFEITKAQLLDSCPSRMGGPNLRPTRSQFLVLDVETALEMNVGEKTGGSPEDLFMPLVTEAFSVIDAGGKRDGNVSSDKAWECYEDSELAPSFLNPGQKAKGKIVLDVAASGGRVVYDPEGKGGWSWPFGG